MREQNKTEIQRQRELSGIIEKLQFRKFNY